MTAPLDLDALEAAARAAGIDDDGQFNASNWYVERDIGHNNCLFASGGKVDTAHIVAASPAVVLALPRRRHSPHWYRRGVDDYLQNL